MPQPLLSFSDSSAQTPLMRQYLEIKKQCPDAILFFRLGDFYEMFFEDAKIAAPILDIALTSRDKKAANPIPLCGVPYHSSKSYIAKLLDAGKKVAICEQVEEASAAKSIVRREIQRLITPGTRSDEEGLPWDQHSFICSVVKDQTGLVLTWVDVHTGAIEFERVSDIQTCKKMISFLDPSELLFKQKDLLKEHFYTFDLPKEVLDRPANVSEQVLSRYQVSHADVLGVDSNLVLEGIDLLLEYVEKINLHPIAHLQFPKAFHAKKYLTLDQATQKNLELFRDKNKKGACLMDVLDYTKTKAGKRKLKQYIQRPLQEKEAIQNRLDWVSFLYQDANVLESLQKALKEVCDLERLMSRLTHQKTHVRDLVAIRQTLSVIPRIKKILTDVNQKTIESFGFELNPCKDLHFLLKKAIAENPPHVLGDGGVIEAGYDSELDRLRELAKNNKQWIANLQVQEREKTKIPSLKVGYNKVFGYYLEVTKAHVEKVPSHYIRKQTLVNAERYITESLKNKEEEILNAKAKYAALEKKIYDQIVSETASCHQALLHLHDCLSFLDVMCSFAYVSKRNQYTRPTFTDQNCIDFAQARHPIVENSSICDAFVPNDVILNPEQSFILLTGPNMAGKSTVMRQTALIVLMAQMGCFVPAQKATLSIVDQIFTRIGAQDDLSQGRSTFMVEMQETAYILHHATKNSLVLLDEVGRGTSTYDGVSIAWAVSEALHDEICAKTIFATHYHELTQLTSQKKHMANYQMVVRKFEDEIIFLKKLQKGSIQRSYGIEVAQLAGIPHGVLDKARSILSSLENSQGPVQAKEMPTKPNPSWLFEEMQELLTDELSPKQALDQIYDWKQRLRKDSSK